MINHTDKKFLTFNQQIDHLIALGLNILNKNRLLKYLKKYNYENIINEFAYIFRESDGVKFKKNITDEDIIFLFNFDQSIRMNILSAIFTIEKHLNTSIAYYICQNKEYTWIDNGQIFNLDRKFFQIIFPKINNDTLYVKFKKDLLHYCEKEKKLMRLYNHVSNNIPIWKMCMYWSLGLSINIYANLNKGIKYKIIKDFLGKNNQTQITDFVSVLKILNKLRNMISHNKKVFDFNTKEWNSFAFHFMDTNGINKNINKQKRKITLCDLCNIINVLNPIGIKNLKLNPLTLLKTKYKQYIETNGIDQKIDDRIKKLINL